MIKLKITKIIFLLSLILTQNIIAVKKIDKKLLCNTPSKKQYGFALFETYPDEIDNKKTKKKTKENLSQQALIITLGIIFFVWAFYKITL
ncbi:MAG: hypothetical protein P4L22_03040 [Candidatus Babeliales bacterium]|nr:hypothetical protein [Candidatus Babeliales bacterium]